MNKLSVKAVGWRVIVAPIPVTDVTKGGIALPTETVKAMEYLGYVGEVVDMGHLAYQKDAFKHHAKADPKPWCKIGDFVAYAKYAGQDIRAVVDGEVHILKILNDDDIMCVVIDPSSLKPVL